ncbi:flagellar assembly protein FliH [Cupriavidus sp. AU9028]|nr:flagellar assembly protein FliH [Cupriavidus sp. AU9028]
MAGSSFGQPDAGEPLFGAQAAPAPASAQRSGNGSGIGGGFQSFDDGALNEPRISRGDDAARANWRRWKMSAFDAPPPPPPRMEPEPMEPAPPPIDFKAIEAMREGARKEGYAQGYSQGQTQGYGDGHREGYARGLEAARQEAARLQQIAATFAGALQRVDEEVGQTLIALALDVARKLVQDTVAQQPSVLLPAVRELLATEPALSGAPCLLLHPDDVALVQQHLAGELEAAGWSVRADGGVERGGCVATAASGELDATLSTRWSRVVKALGRDDPWGVKDA